MSTFKNLQKPSSFIDLLRFRVEQNPEQRLYTFLVDGENEETHLTCGELDRQARAIGALLQSMKMSGERALLLYTPGLEHLAGVSGCLYAGTIAVSAYPPDPSMLQKTLPQFLAIVKDAQAKVILTTKSVFAKRLAFFLVAPELKKLKWVATDAVHVNEGEKWVPPVVLPNTPAFLQYSSGSTGNPKGVLLSSRNILCQAIGLCEVTGQTSDTVRVSWLPLYHNLGMAAAIQPIITGGAIILMSPLSFLQRPFRWLQAISRYRATHSSGPNFAYELCVNQTTNAERMSLDLRSWEIASCGAEVIRAETLERFVKTFASCGFRPEAFSPGYGLAEATLVISCGLRGSRPMIKSIDRKALQKDQVVEVSEKSEESQRVVGCGKPVPGQKVVIVNPWTLKRCSSGQVGEIWVSGPNVALGYWNQPEVTKETFQAFLSDTGEGPFLRTGDLGFLQDEELFLTGRLKDLIIIRGRNHYPQDIERTVEKVHSALRVSGGAAFSVDVENEERLVIIQEIESLKQSEMGKIIQRIREAVAKEHGIQVYAIVLIKPGTLPKTRNVKAQRYACRLNFVKRDFDEAASWYDTFSKTKNIEAAPIEKIPRTVEDIEPWLISRISKRLRIQSHEVDLTKPLASYGLDSLAVVELANDIEVELRIPILIINLFESPSIRRIIEDLKAQFQMSALQSESQGITLDLDAEAHLDSSISFSSPCSPKEKPDSIFLTGATGFVGSFLLHELFYKTQAKIYCLVRGKDDVEATERIRKNLEGYSLWNEEMGSRIFPIRGDLAKPLFGLSLHEFQKLAHNVDAIYHSGAVVNFVYSYRDLKASNVLGTQEVIRLACESKLKPLFYISTISAFPILGHPEGKEFFENDELKYNQGLMNGYAQSKWVAEKLIREACSKGLPVIIYRVGEVIGHSQTGVCQAARDAYSLFIKGGILLGIVPDINFMIHAIPVDYVAKAVVHLSWERNFLGKVFHLFSPHPVSVSQLYEFMISLGYPLKRIPYEEWLDEVLNLMETNSQNPLSSFLPMLRSPIVKQFGKTQSHLELNCKNTMESLVNTLSWPNPGIKLFHTYFTYLIRSGFLPSPASVV